MDWQAFTTLVRTRSETLMQAKSSTWHRRRVVTPGVAPLLLLVLCALGCGCTPFIGTSQGSPMREVTFMYGRTKLSFEPETRQVTLIGLRCQERIDGPYLHLSQARTI